MRMSVTLDPYPARDITAHTMENTMPESETAPESLDILAVHAATQPDKIALICDEKSHTCSQHNARANRAANALLELGIHEGDRAAGMGFNSIEGSVLGAGLRKAGGVGVPVNY